MADTPLHVHERDDELLYVLEGEHVFQVGDDDSPSGREASSSLPVPSLMHSGASFRVRGGCSC